LVVTVVEISQFWNYPYLALLFYPHVQHILFLVYWAILSVI